MRGRSWTIKTSYTGNADPTKPIGAIMIIPAILSLLMQPVEAGVIDDPSRAYQVWYSQDWITAPPAINEIVPEASPGRATVTLLPAIETSPEPPSQEAWVERLKQVVQERKAGKIMSEAPLVSIDGRMGAVVYTVRVGAGGIRQYGFAALPLGGGKASLVMLETEQTSAFNDHRDEFCRISSTAMLPGRLQDIEFEELQRLFKKP